MPDILHRVEMKSSPADAYRALATIEGLASWWTTDTRGTSKVGDVIEFRFGTRGHMDMRVLELETGKRVLWQVVDGPKEWIGTKISFDLKQNGDFTGVSFKHQGWKEPIEFMHHCSTKWASYMLSLKQFLETGTGSAFPDDVEISNWP